MEEKIVADYQTSYNGGNPYVVKKSKKSKKCKNCKKSKENYLAVIDNYSERNVLQISADQVWIGKSPQTPTTEMGGGYGDYWDGNTILVRVTENRYVFIGHFVFSFVTDKPILKYVSEVGNNEVPYPYAVDTENTFYLMAEKIKLSIPEGPYRTDPYGYHYGNRGISKSFVRIPGDDMNVTILHDPDIPDIPDAEESPPLVVCCKH